MRLIVVTSLFLLVGGVSADDVLLSDGRVLHGSVVSVDQYFLKLRSADGTETSYQRAVVSGVRFGSASPVRGSAATTRGPRPSLGNKGVSSDSISIQQFLQQMSRDPDAEIRRIEDLFGITDSDRQQTPQQVIQALQNKGSVDQSVLSEVFRTFPLLNNPNAKRYFDDTLQGLISGEKSLEELRVDAIDARRKLRELRRFSGPENAAWLDNYSQVLDRFISESGQN